MAKAAQLGPANWLVLLRASIWLLLVDGGLRLLGYARMQRLLRRARRGCAPQGRVAGEPCIERSIARISYLTDVAAQYHLYRMTCLPRALVLQRLLAGVGVEADLKIGVRREGNRLLAHAWLVHQGKPIGEPRDPAALFALLTCARPRTY